MGTTGSMCSIIQIAVVGDEDEASDTDMQTERVAFSQSIPEVPSFVSAKTRSNNALPT